MKFSVIIAVEAVGPYLRENISRLLEMDFQDFEILLFLSEPSEESFSKTRIVVSPDLASLPALRRDLAIGEAQGEILAFIDDDAYPSRRWLSEALKHFDDPKVAAVGGPGVTPPQDDWRQQVSGWAQASPLGGSWQVFFRFRPIDRRREVDDYPSMNLLVRKSDFAMVGGFDSSYYPGEDTKLCLDLTLKLSKKIVYDPAVLVYHHRRRIFMPHLIQVGRYGLHRGFFARTLPQTSRRLIYFLPSVFLLFVVLTPVTILISRTFNPSFSFFNFARLSVLYLAVILFYGLLLLFNSLWVWRRCRSFKIALWLMPVIFATHLWYGFQFIRGFFSRSLKR